MNTYKCPVIGPPPRPSRTTAARLSKLLRASTGATAAKILTLGGIVSMSDRVTPERDAEIGVNAYLNKPANTVELTACLRRLFKR